jgi:uncharacterized protein (DUF2461 family)
MVVFLCCIEVLSLMRPEHLQQCNFHDVYNRRASRSCSEMWLYRSACLCVSFGYANACSEGGGLWCPAAEPLSFLRRDIDRKPHNIKRVLTDAGIRKEFLGGVANDEKKAVTAFCSQSENASNALKTKPKVR